MSKCSIALVSTLLLLAACSRDEPAPTTAESPAPWVRTIPVKVRAQSGLLLTGTVRARFETPLAFQVGGRIAARHADAGQRVGQGQLLFELDPRDLEQSVRAAEAEQAAAQAALATASAELNRNRELLRQNLISRQAAEKVELAEREVKTRLDAAKARLQQARNALGYGALRAETPGVLVEVSGESGQVVAPGQGVAVLARDGEREIELFLPDGIRAHPAGSAQLADGTARALSLREVAGAADPASRTWRARYRVGERDRDLPLGSVVRVAFTEEGDANRALEVPIGALDERGEGPRLWQVVEGQARPLPARVVALDHETARVVADLPPQARVVGLGTHLLAPGMAVRELAP